VLALRCACAATHQANYGQNDPAKVAAIKAVYADLKLEEQYQAYEQTSYEELSALIQGQELLPQALFMDMLTKARSPRGLPAAAPACSALHASGGHSAGANPLVAFRGVQIYKRVK
jgi:hypothetical protein